MVGIRFGFSETLYPVMTSLPEGEAIGDRQPQEEVFLSSGTWTHPGATTITHVDVLLVGGGGGGGGGTYSPGNYFGGAGGGGGVRRMSVPVSSSPGTYAVTIGAAGGVGPQGNNATAGGDSSFGGSVYPGLSPTSNVVGGGGLGRGGAEGPTTAALADAPAEGGGGGSQAGRPEDGGVVPWMSPDPQGPRRGGAGGANGQPADPSQSNAFAGGAGTMGGGITGEGTQSGRGKYGYGGGGAGKGVPASNYWYFPMGAMDGGGIGGANTTITGPSGAGYPWSAGGITNAGGGGYGGQQLNWNPTSPTLAAGGAGGSGLCVVRWWE